MVAKEFEINGCVDISENPVSLDEFNDKFIEWIESNGWYFGGVVKPYSEE